MVHTQALGQQQVLCPHHVVIGVFRETHAHSIAGFAGLSKPDSVGQNDVMRRAVKQLPRPEKLVGESFSEESLAGAAGAMENEHGVYDLAGGVALRLADSGVVQSQFGESLAGAELEVLSDPVALSGNRVHSAAHHDQKHEA